MDEALNHLWFSLQVVWTEVRYQLKDPIVLLAVTLGALFLLLLTLRRRAY